MIKFSARPAIIGNRLLALLLAGLCALGMTMLAGGFMLPFVDGLWTGRVFLAAGLLASFAGIFGWFIAAPHAAMLVARFRSVAIAEFMGFGLI
ncbi:MAG: hypothetical protein WD645_02295, partial [Dehalococcoidia bacterium]